MSQVKTFLDRVGTMQDSFVLYADRLMGIEEGSGTNFVSFFGSSFRLVPSLQFNQLEAFDSRAYASQILSESRYFVKQTVDREVKAEKDLKGEASRIKALEFIVFDFLPLLYSKKYKTSDHLAEMFDAGKEEGDASGFFVRARDELQQKLDNDFGTEAKTEEDQSEKVRNRVLASEKERVRTESIVPVKYTLKELGLTTRDVSDSVTGRLTGLQPLYVIDNRVYSLVPVNGRVKKDIVFNIHGKEYVPGEVVSTVSQLSKELSNRREILSNITALEGSQNDFSLIKEVLAANDKKQRQMVELARLKEYDLGSCGFVLKDGNYYVYSRIPKFATQDGRDPKVFWTFPTVRVAIQIGWNDKAYTSDSPIVVEAMNYHPCMKNRKEGYSTICNLNRQPSDYRNTPLDMLRKLSDAVNVVMHPLNKESLDAHSGHTYFGTTLTDILKQESLTREQAVGQGYEIAEVIQTRVGRSKR